MKLILITTRDNLNPGDQFIRLGVERLVKDTGIKDIEIVRLSKESESDMTNVQPFDKVILCGMPLWWNNPVSTSQSIGWWGPLMRGWLSERKKDFLVLGAGPVLGEAGAYNQSEYEQAYQETVQRAWKVTSRQPTGCEDVQTSICPAAFAEAPAHEKPFRFLCNLMAHGAHDPHFDLEEAAIWKEELPGFARHLKEQDFEFVAHDLGERDLALKYTDKVHFYPTPEEYLKLYAESKFFIGNRLHGAMRAALTGNPTVAIGYDSRKTMLAPFTPIRWCPSAIKRWNPLFPNAYNLYPMLDTELIERELKVNQQIVHSFLSQ